jgi:hypothetical protein
LSLHSTDFIVESAEERDSGMSKPELRRYALIASDGHVGARIGGSKPSL